MTEYREIYGDNQEQGEYWNDVGGPKWVEEDQAMNDRMSNITSGLFERAKIKSSSKVLDVGCGAGAVSIIAAEHAGLKGKVTGLDISEPLIKLASIRTRKYKTIDLIQGDAQSIKLKPTIYDHIISRFGVMFFEKPVQAFQNLHSSLVPGGTIVFVCWGPIDGNEFFCLPIDAVLNALKLPRPEITNAPGPLAYSDTGYIHKILHSAGFSGIKIDTVETTMVSKDTAEMHARLYLKIGPAARLIAEHDIDSILKNKIELELSKQLTDRKTETGISLKANVHYISAMK